MSHRPTFWRHLLSSVRRQCHGSPRTVLVILALFLSVTIATAGAAEGEESEHEEHEAPLPHQKVLRSAFGSISNPYPVESDAEKKDLGFCNFWSYGWTQGWEEAEWGPTDATRFRLLNIKQAFWERELRLTYAYADDAEGGEAHEQEMEFELELPMSRRFMIEFEGPLVGLKEKGEDWTYGAGDLKAIPQVMLAENDDMSFSSGLEIRTPTGREGVGGGRTALMPYVAYWRDLGHRIGLHTFLGSEFLLDEYGPAAPDTVIQYGVAPAMTFTRKHRPYFGNFTLFTEFNGETDIGADNNGQRVTFLPGARWMILDETWIAIGEEFPISGDQSFDHKFWLSLYMDF